MRAKSTNRFLNTPAAVWGGKLSCRPGAFFTDGTTEGTRLVREFGTGGRPCAALENLTSVDSRLFLSHATFQPIFKGCQRPDFVSSTLWIGDGTDDGTTLLGAAWNVADTAALRETALPHPVRRPKRACRGQAAA